MGGTAVSAELIINAMGEENRVALLEDGQVVELYIERRRDASLVGNIYKGKVIKVLPGMQSSFIDIGLEKATFLYVADIMRDLEEYYSAFVDNEIVNIDYNRNEFIGKPLSIEELIQEGQELLVQVSKDPIGTKGARVTSYITIPGRYIVLMPNVEHIGISRRIENEETRQRLKNIAAEIKPKNFGLIMRTASEDATKEEICKDLEFLLLLWENIQMKKDKLAAPALLYSDMDLLFRSVRDFMTHDVERLVIDSPEEYERLREFAKNYFPKLIDKIELYEGKEPIFDAFAIELDISRALGRRVWLKSGGYIVIDQTEAMTVIDVNTGKFVGKESLEETILKTNLEAAKEIAYQIRLRNIGGIIIIDFIDMEKVESREKVLRAFTDFMKKDRSKSTIYNISELGIVQMTRKRVRDSLERVLCENCPYCEGRGFVKSTRTITYEILRKLKKMNPQKGSTIIINANPAVAELLSDEERSAVEDVEKTFNVNIIIKEDNNIHQENYKISVV
ncbi:MAG: Rne/Rng family ribonuclease [Thermodesulfovibrionales bacterium]|nr:Rne/Rng family ribonuclease [Thermodesulfovibrionales bacterium]